MPTWLHELRSELDALASQDLLRGLRAATPVGRIVHIEGRDLVNLASNDYLGLSAHPRVRAAAAEAIERYGVGAGASRLVTGHTPLHAEVEAKFAAFKHAEAALIVPTGYMANLAVLGALAQPGDLICMDKLNHASLIDAARASGATVRVYPHGDLRKLERLLGAGNEKREEGRVKSEAKRGSGEGGKRSDAKAQVGYDAPRSSHHAPRSSHHAPRSSRRFIVTDAIFSMDGDAADLPALCDLARRYDAMLIVDEAHGTGVLGESGAGLCELQGVADRVDIVVSTASKALGGLGGIVTAKRIVIDTLINRARPFIFTTGATPAQVAALGVAMDIVRDEPWRRQRLIAHAARLRAALGLTDALVTPIVPVITGAAASALALAARLAEAGFHAPAIRPPTVPPNQARVRISLRADLEDEDVERLIDCLKGCR